jgi:hypothetical protein
MCGTCGQIIQHRKKMYYKMVGFFFGISGFAVAFIIRRHIDTSR